MCVGCALLWKTCSALLLVKVRIEMKRVERGEVNSDGTPGPNALQTSAVEPEHVPLGARLCDRLLFGEQKLARSPAAQAGALRSPLLLHGDQSRPVCH